MKNRKVTKVVMTLLVFLIASIGAIYFSDLYNNKIWSFTGMNNDGQFHLMRIEGLTDSIRNHDYFPIVNTAFMGGFGYIANIFYADLWLYPAAILRLYLPMSQALIIYYVLINFITFLTSFGSFYKASSKYWNSFVFSFVYTLSTYRIFDMTRRYDIGETETMIFLPIVLLGVYEIFYKNKNEWFYLTIGMVGIIYSHALSPILVAIFICLVILFRINMLRKEPGRIKSFLWAIVTSLLLSVAYFLPMIEQLKHTQFKLTSPDVNIGNTAINVKEFINWNLADNLYQQSVGPIILIAALLALFSFWKIKNTAVRDFTVIGLILLVATTTAVPWNIIEHTPIKMIQFPWRFNMIVSILLAVYLASGSFKWMQNRFFKMGVVFLTFGCIISADYSLTQQHPAEENSYHEFDRLDSFSIGGGREYLPKDANFSQLLTAKHKPIVESGQVQLSGFRQQGSKVTFRFQNAKDAKVSVPVILYYGYTAKGSSGKVTDLKMNQQNNGLGQVTLNGSGFVKVSYHQTLIQKLSRSFSIVSLLLMLGYAVYRRERSRI